jgi:hypothetical protein
MLRLNRFLWADPRGFLTRRVPIPLPGVSQVTACLSILGLVGLSFLLGAAVMFFRLPPAAFLDSAFTGAKAWHERGLSQDGSILPAAGMAREGVVVDKPDKTYDGFTLFTTVRGSRAKLIDMRGNAIHQWEMPFHRAWPDPSHVKNPLSDKQIHWFRCHLYGNGDLLAVYHADGDTPYGYGLVKLNKDSRLLWSYAGHAHHDLDVDADGTIYTLGQKLASKPPPGLDSLPGPLIADSIVILSPEGHERETIPILQAFRDSPYADLLLASIDLSPGRDAPSLPETKGDLVHANSVKVLTQALAPKFPQFKAGQVLISLRKSNLIAVLDPHARSVVWASRGVWQSQHDAEFLDNGHLLLFDNSGSGNGSRVVEYDPLTQAVPWIYASENAIPFRASSRGMKQRLPNGNTLIVDPDNWLLLEVTQRKELVWQSSCGGVVTGARRYHADELPFLKGGSRARP